MKHLCVLITFAALLTLSRSEDFKTIPFHDGAFVSQTISEFANENNTNDFIGVQPDFPYPFTVAVSLGDNYTEVNNPDPKPTMMIMISSNVTVLGVQTGSGFLISEFHKYNCTPSLTCIPYSAFDNTVIAEYIAIPGVKSFKAYEGYNTPVSFGNGSWSLSSPVYILGDDELDVNYYDPGATYGMIGLGAGGDAIHNYQDDHALFSLSFEDNAKGGGNGSLIFGNDTTKANNSTFVTSLPTDENWVMTVVNVSFNGANLTGYDPNPTPLIFDLEQGRLGSTITESIHLPEPIYSALQSVLCSFTGVTCYSGVLYDYPKGVPDFPDLIFIFEDGSQLAIPASLYMVKNEHSGARPALSCTNDLTVGLKRDDLIVLGWPILSNFYSVFERVNDTSRIGLYSTPRTKVSIVGDNQAH